ncbi:hypothetical protein H6775_01135 [Candidatus Nomurabacteria bacterium]|nr:hypothetical protein [Candidatus Nomurabacteria bacterium]
MKDEFIKLAAIIFSLVAILHLWIIVSGSVLSVNGVALGSWVSYLAFVVTGFMAIKAFKMKK